MNEIKEKTYTEILSELDSYHSLKTIVMSIALIQIIYDYILIKTKGFTFSTIGIFFLTISYFILPLIIELVMKKSNKHISY